MVSFGTLPLVVVAVPGVGGNGDAGKTEGKPQPPPPPPAGTPDPKGKPDLGKVTDGGKPTSPTSPQNNPPIHPKQIAAYQKIAQKAWHHHKPQEAKKYRDAVVSSWASQRLLEIKQGKYQVPSLEVRANVILENQSEPTIGQNQMALETIGLGHLLGKYGADGKDGPFTRFAMEDFVSKYNNGEFSEMEGKAKGTKPEKPIDAASAPKVLQNLAQAKIKKEAAEEYPKRVKADLGFELTADNAEKVRSYLAAVQEAKIASITRKENPAAWQDAKEKVEARANELGYKDKNDDRYLNIVRTLNNFHNDPKANSLVLPGDTLDSRLIPNPPANAPKQNASPTGNMVGVGASGEVSGVVAIGGPPPFVPIAMAWGSGFGFF